MRQIKTGFIVDTALVLGLALGGCTFSASAGKGSLGNDPSSSTSSRTSKPSSKSTDSTQPRSAAKPVVADNSADLKTHSSATPAAEDGPGQGKDRRCDNAGKKKGHDKGKAKGEAKGHDMCDD
jgi:hypothetical protein